MVCFNDFQNVAETGSVNEIAPGQNQIASDEKGNDYHLPIF